MQNWILQLVFSAAIFLGSSLSGMAKEAIAEENHPQILVAGEISEDSSKQVLLVFSDEGMLPSFSVEEQSEGSVQNGNEQKRNQKRASSPERFLSKCRFSSSLSAKSAARGMARHPQSQDARQERTETIRFLQLASLVC